MLSYYRDNDEPFEYKGRTMSLASNYRMLTAQCLLLADYTKPVNYMIETMLLHLRCEHAKSKDAEVGIWVLIGMIVRLAMRGGYVLAHLKVSFTSRNLPANSISSVIIEIRRITQVSLLSRAKCAVGFGPLFGHRMCSSRFRSVSQA